MTNISQNTSSTWQNFWNKNLLNCLCSSIRNHFVSRKMAKFLIKNSQKGKILEAGSGMGLSSIYTKALRDDEVTLCDIIESPLIKAKQFAKQQNLDIITSVCDINQLSTYYNQKFDIVWNIGTLEHFKNPEKILHEMAHTGNKIICIVPERSLFWTILYKVSLLTKRIPNDFFVIWYSKDELKALVSKSGFQEAAIKRIRVFWIIKYLALIIETS